MTELLWLPQTRRAAGWSCRQDQQTNAGSLEHTEEQTFPFSLRSAWQRNRSSVSSTTAPVFPSLSNLTKQKRHSSDSNHERHEVI